jgi:hypothetical protein
MRNTIFDMDSSLRGQRPEPEGEAGVDQHRACHPLDDLVGTFGNSVLLGRVRDSPLVSDAVFLAVGLELAVDELGGIVDS